MILLWVLTFGNKKVLNVLGKYLYFEIGTEFGEKNPQKGEWTQTGLNENKLETKTSHSPDQEEVKVMDTGILI